MPRRFALIAPLLSTACGTTLDGAPSGPEGHALILVDTARGAQSQGALFAAMFDHAFDALPDGATPADAAQLLADALPDRFAYAGCATATATGAQVDVSFDACAVPRGTGSISGDLAVRIASVQSGTVTATILAADHTKAPYVDVAQLFVDATVHVVVGSPGALAIDSRTTGYGEGFVPDVGEFSLAGAYTASFDASCASAMGTLNTTDAIAVSRCSHECIRGTIDGANSLHVAFDGTGVALWATDDDDDQLSFQCSTAP